MMNALLFLMILFVWIMCVGIAGSLVCGVTWLVVKPAVRPMIPAFAIQAGHALISFPLLLILFLLIELNVSAFAVSLLMLCGLMVVLVWLITRPGPIPVIVLTVIHILDFGLACLFAASNLDMAALGGVAANFLLRVSSIALMVVGLWIITKTQRPVEQSTRENVTTSPITQPIAHS